MKNERKRLYCFGLVFTACSVLGTLLKIPSIEQKERHRNRKKNTGRHRNRKKDTGRHMNRKKDIGRHRNRKKNTGRHRNRKKDRHRNRKTDTETERQTDTETERHRYIQTNGRTHRRTDGRTDTETDRKTDTEGFTDNSNSITVSYSGTNSMRVYSFTSLASFLLLLLLFCTLDKRISQAPRSHTAEAKAFP